MFLTNISIKLVVLFLLLVLIFMVHIGRIVKTFIEFQLIFFNKGNLVLGFLFFNLFQEFLVIKHGLVNIMGLFGFCVLETLVVDFNVCIKLIEFLKEIQPLE